MNSIFELVTGLGTIVVIAYLLLILFAFIYFFRMAKDLRAVRKSLDDIKVIMQKERVDGDKVSK